MKIVAVMLLLVLAVESADEGEGCMKEGIAGWHCGFDGIVPIVCCVSNATGPIPITPPTTTRPVFSTSKRSQITTFDVDVKSGNKRCDPVRPALTSKPTGQKAWDKCLEYQEKLVYPCVKSPALIGGWVRSNRCKHNVDELIVGGTKARENEFPHMALLGYGEDPSNLRWLCGGSLISERFVLTAGHCIATSDAAYVSHVQLATLHRSTMPPKYRYRVKRIIKHPLYHSPVTYHDIALLELEKPVALDEFTVPACVHTGDLVDDSRASTAGWGTTSYNGKISEFLQKTILTKFDFLECTSLYPHNRNRQNGLDYNSQICYGHKTLSRDTCKGDSGGPLQIKSEKISCMYVLVGVTSYSSGCGFVGVPGVYTRVAHYLDWIEATVWP